MIALKKLCLDLILQEFERFRFAFTVSNDVHLEKNFEFLKRKYSSELCSQLFQKGCLKEEYLDFLLNEHLTVLDDSWLKKTRYENTTNDILCRLPNLLEITCSVCSDQMLENIAKHCPKIVEIRAACSSVTNNGIGYLCKNESGQNPCPNLKNLLIQLSNITDEDVKDILENLPSLERIHHENLPEVLYSLHKGYLPELENLPSYKLVELKLLHLGDLPYYSDILKICLTVCPKLQSMSCCISEKEQLNFLNNSNLKELNLKISPNIPEVNLSDFLKINGCNLISLGISNCIVSVCDMALSCPKLQHLIVDNVTLPDNSGSRPIFHYLVKCSFMNITDNASMQKVARLLLCSSSKLTKLEFIACTLSHETQGHILKYLKEIFLEEITFAPVDRRYMDFLKAIHFSCPLLKTLKLDNTNLNFNEKCELCEFYRNYYDMFSSPVIIDGVDGILYVNEHLYIDPPEYDTVPSEQDHNVNSEPDYTVPSEPDNSSPYRRFFFGPINIPFCKR